MENEIKYFFTGESFCSLESDNRVLKFEDHSGIYVHTVNIKKKIDKGTKQKIETEFFTLDELIELLKPFL
jgi:hypothetical protein